MEYTIRGRCGQEGCRERRYYLDEGLWFCRQGHQQEGRQVEAEQDQFGTQGKTNRIKKVIAEKGRRTYGGRRAYTLFLQAYQFVLWKQCYAFVHGRGFPAQFESVIRDMWALRLDLYSDKIKETPGEDDELELFSSQPGTDVESEPEDFKPKSQWPRLIDTVALCYLGALLMRIPLSVCDLHRMIVRGDVPYIRVIKQIPREMRDKLPQEYISIFETSRLLEAEQLHKAVSDLSHLYHRKFGVQFPPLNHPPLSYRFIRRLALPIEIYSAAKRLQPLLGFTFEYATRIVGKRRALDIPELQLMSLIVISTKLHFPFDYIKRYPSSAQEPTTQSIDWNTWGQAQRYFDSHETSGDRIGKGNEILVKENDVFDMTLNQLDEYMDWYENNWLDSSKAKNPLADLFPTSTATGENQSTGSAAGAVQAPAPAPASKEDENEAMSSMVQTVTGQLKSRRIIAEDEAHVPRPGTSYPRYRMESDLPEAARPFFETAAQVVGVSLPTLVRAVYQAETRIYRWLEDQRRIEYFADHSEMDGVGDISDAAEEIDDHFMAD